MMQMLISCSWYGYLFHATYVFLIFVVAEFSMHPNPKYIICSCTSKVTHFYIICLDSQPQYANLVLLLLLAWWALEQFNSWLFIDDHWPSWPLHLHGVTLCGCDSSPTTWTEFIGKWKGIIFYEQCLSDWELKVKLEFSHHCKIKMCLILFWHMQFLFR